LMTVGCLQWTFNPAPKLLRTMQDHTNVAIRNVIAKAAIEQVIFDDLMQGNRYKPKAVKPLNTGLMVWLSR
jgi:hypothetical protein